MILPATVVLSFHALSGPVQIRPALTRLGPFCVVCGRHPRCREGES